MKKKLLGILFILLFALTGCAEVDEDLPTVGLNQPIAMDTCELTILDVGFYDQILILDEDGKIAKDLKTDCPDGLKLLGVQCTLKNLKAEPINIAETLSVISSYGKYKYDESYYIGWKLEDEMKPAAAATFYAYTYVPEEALENPDEVRCKITLNGQQYVYQGDITDYYNYYKTVNEILNIEKFKVPYSDYSEAVKQLEAAVYSSDQQKLKTAKNNFYQATDKMCQYYSSMAEQTDKIEVPTRLKDIHPKLIDLLLLNVDSLKAMEEQVASNWSVEGNLVEADNSILELANELGKKLPGITAFQRTN